VNRKIKTEGEGWFSGKWVMSQNEQWLKRGAYILNFPEGTRKSSGEGGRLGPFKPGPFALSQRTQAPVVPITFSGARSIFPPGWPQLKFGEVVITVHKALPPPSTLGSIEETRAAVEAQMSTARANIESALRPVDDIPVKVEAQKHK
jgi:1-acyl-sn-glycerol-3-phosphate acyltransferase